MLGKAGGEEEEMAGWHHQFNGHESEPTSGGGEGQGGLEGCNPWGCKESDRTEQLNLTESYTKYVSFLAVVKCQLLSHAEKQKEGRHHT